VVSTWSPSKTVSIVAAPTVDYRVTVKEITDEFAENEYAATQKYKGKNIAVTGYVTSIGIGYADKPVVHLHERPDPRLLDPAVLCFFDKEGPHPGLAELRKGDYVTIVGKFWFYSFRAVYLDHSYIE